MGGGGGGERGNNNNSKSSPDSSAKHIHDDDNNNNSFNTHFFFFSSNFKLQLTSIDFFSLVFTAACSVSPLPYSHISSFAALLVCHPFYDDSTASNCVRV